MTTPEPKKVRLTEDFLDLKVGMAYPAGTILHRLSAGEAPSQYGLEGTRLGQECVTGFFLIRHVCEVLEP